MLNNKGVSIVSLVVTIILIIILAAISTPILSSVIDDSFEEDAKVELKNVQNVVPALSIMLMSISAAAFPELITIRISSALSFSSSIFL